LPKLGTGPARYHVKLVKIVCDTGQKSTFAAILPKGETTNRLCAFDSRVEPPQLIAGCGIECEDLARGRRPIKCAPDYDGRGFYLTDFATIELPRYLHAAHIEPVDLVQRRVAIAGSLPAVNRPVHGARRWARLLRGLQFGRQSRKHDYRRKD